MRLTNLFERIATLHLDLGTGRGFGRRCRRGGGSRGTFGRCCLDRTGCGLRGCGFGLGFGRGRRRSHFRGRFRGLDIGDGGWIDQRRIGAHQAARGPGKLDQEVDERFVQWLIRRDLDVRIAVGTLLDRQFQAGHIGGERQIRLLERVGRRQLHGQRRRLLLLDRNQIDFGTERLAERRHNVQLAQPCCVGRRGPRAESHRKGDRANQRFAHRTTLGFRDV